MLTLVRVVSWLSSLVFLLLAFGFSFQQPWATALWPWPDGRLSYLFIASICAAIAVPVLWLTLIPDWRAAVAGGLNLTVTFAGMAASLLLLWLGGQSQLLPFLIAFALIALYYLAGAVWAGQRPLQDQRRMPGLVRLSLWVFAGVLVLAALALLFKAPTIFPWALKPESSVLFGWVFLGAAVYFAYGGLQRHWHAARGQLIGFLAYYLVLIGPFLALFASVTPEHFWSLAIYVLVLVYSGALAIYYLFISPRTRGWRIMR